MFFTSSEAESLIAPRSNTTLPVSWTPRHYPLMAIGGSLTALVASLSTWGMLAGVARSTREECSQNALYAERGMEIQLALCCMLFVIGSIVQVCLSRKDRALRAQITPEMLAFDQVLTAPPSILQPVKWTLRHFPLMVVCGSLTALIASLSAWGLLLKGDVQSKECPQNAMNTQSALESQIYICAALVVASTMAQFYVSRKARVVQWDLPQMMTEQRFKL